ncbi:MAG: hypothetical protein PVI90_13775 [Desulfobacteraceae bacterium]|jgi:hypothetical protein
MMDNWVYWIYLKIGLSVFAALTCVISGVIVWRVRGIWQWQRSLNTEIKYLEKNAMAIRGPKRSAILLVIERCNKIRQSRSPSLDLVFQLDLFLRNIAACYHPDADRPELCVSLGQTLAAAGKMADRLEKVIRRKGLRRFARIRVRHIHKTLSWYEWIYHHPILGWFLRHQKMVARFMHYKRFLLPDPFTWVAYFSNRLTILIMTRTLLLDLYLFIGNLAVEAYDPQDAKDEKSLDSDCLAESLKTLYDSELFNGWQGDPEILEIRARLVGMPKKIIIPPTFAQWRQSVIEAANIIARRNFSESKVPLEEAALGPIIVRLQSLLRSISEVSHYSGVKQLFALRLELLYNAHALVGNLAELPVTGIAQKFLGGYRKVRWPLKIYRWVKRSSPGGIAMDLGWEVFRKTLINYMARFTFDRFCQEVEGIYKNSRK